jgi:hypothetical protein
MREDFFFSPASIIRPRGRSNPGWQSAIETARTTGLAALGSLNFFLFAKSEWITLKVAAASASSFQDLFHLPLSGEAYALEELQSVLQNLHLQETHRIWIYIWGFTFFSSKKAYEQ